MNSLPHVKGDGNPGDDGPDDDGGDGGADSFASELAEALLRHLERRREEPPCDRPGGCVWCRDADGPADGDGTAGEGVGRG